MFSALMLKTESAESVEEIHRALVPYSSIVTVNIVFVWRCVYSERSTCLYIAHQKVSVLFTLQVEIVCVVIQQFNLHYVYDIQ